MKRVKPEIPAKIKETYKPKKEEKQEEKQDKKISSIYIIDNTIEGDERLRDILKLDFGGIEVLKIVNRIPKSLVRDASLRNQFYENISEIMYDDSVTDVLPGKITDNDDLIRLAWKRFWEGDEEEGGIPIDRLSPGTTLEIVDTFIHPSIHMRNCKSDTLILSYSDSLVRNSRYRIPILRFAKIRENCKGLYRIIIGRGAVLDCSELVIQHLVGTNILSFRNISKGRVTNLYYMNEVNPNHDDDDHESLQEKIPQLRLPNDIVSLWIPDSQEFHLVGGWGPTLQFIGILPTSFYPSRLTMAVQKTWQPHHHECIEKVLLEQVYL